MSVLVVLLLIGAACESAVAGDIWMDDPIVDETRESRDLSAPFRELADLVAQLMATTSDTNDTDVDGLPDSVEWVIGTDPLNNDTDHDRIDDWSEIQLQLDPRRIDSNLDGLPDCFEVTDVHLDLDGDGTPNAWDWDNDGDAVVDNIDLSPFAKTGTHSSFNLSINSTGKPTYVNLQVRTNNPDNLRLIDQVWDWPNDDKGQMQDLDGSDEDVVVSPMLVFESNTPMDMLDVAEYGMFVDGLTAYIPLVPVKDYGNTVAFNARMFIPDLGGSAHVSGNMSLQWLVTGYSDSKVYGLEAPSGDHVSVNLTGVVRANASTLSSNEGFVISTSGDGNLLLKASNGRYLRVGSGGIVEASAIETDRYCEFIKETSGDGIVLKSAGNNRYLSVDASDGALYANVAAKADAAVFTQTTPWIQPYSKTLAVYPEDFMLTGMIVEENFGSDFGAFYGGSVDNLTAANILLAYEFLRNGTNAFADMPARLANNSISVQNKTASFPHRDLAVVATTGQGLRDLLGTLPDHEILPIINIMEDRSSSLELAELGGASYIKGRSLSVNLDAQQVVTARILKTNWYNTDNDTYVEIGPVLQDMEKYGLSDESMVLLAALSLVWNVGEHTVVRVGNELVDFEIPNLEKYTDIAFNVASYGLAGLSEAASQIQKTVKYGVTLEEITDAKFLKNLVDKDLMELTAKGAKILDKVSSTSTKLKWANRVSDVLDFLGFVADIGIAIFTFVAMIKESGWNAVGVGSALVTSTLLLAYGLAVGWIAGMLGMCGPAGWVFAGVFLLLVAFSEFMSWLCSGESWAEGLVNRLVESMTDQVVRSEVSCDVLFENLTILDHDGNGLDVGDRIQYNCDIKTTVKAKRYSKPGITRYRGPETSDLDDSYLTVTSYVLENGVNVRRGNSIPTTDTETKYYREETISLNKYTTYNLAPYFDPQTPAINYKFTVVLGFDSKVIYWSCFAFIMWWCSRESQTDSFERTWNTFYFDIMPGTIDEFAGWNAITSCDSDGDGLKDAEETGSNPMLWDTDGDGLGDRYEQVIGTDPRAADSDGDWLDDRLEIQLGTNAKSPDTDSDGLDDAMEYRGWVTSFNYSGREFFWHVASDPTLNDTDHDRVGDYLEYWCLLNPMSADTDGDGVMDRAQDYWITEFGWDSVFEYVTDDYTQKIEIDDDGYVYQMYREGYPPTRQGFYVYNPNGTLNTTWSIPLGLSPYDFDIGSDGYLYVILTNRSYPYQGFIKRFSRTGSSEVVVDLGTGVWFGLIAVDIDNGHLYIGGGEACQTVFQFNLTGKILNYFTIGSPWGFQFGTDGCLYTFVRKGGQYKVVRLDPESGTYTSFGASGSVNGTFNDPRDIAVDSNGFILVADSDNDRVQKFDPRGRYVGKFNFTGIDDQLLYGPRSLCVDGDDNILVLEQSSGRIHKYTQSYTLIEVEQEQIFTDTDEDGLPDVTETDGWEITVTNLTGTWDYNVTSDPLIYDTDSDGLSDKAELDLGTDPRRCDTDGDGTSDYEEAGPAGMSLNCRAGDGRTHGDRAALGTSPIDWDSDNDGLGDGVEVTFTSDPMNNDTDTDGLLDFVEFDLGADPTSGDTDFDGLDDLAEKDFGSNLLTQDGDDDLLSDLAEFNLDTDPNNNDTDGDGLLEGYEVVHRTNPVNNDTDDDGLFDGFEVVNLMNASNADTDGDNVTDSEELAQGLNPRSTDSDGDGIPDELDVDHALVLDDDVVLVMDPGVPAGDLVDVLSREATVVHATPAELLDEHTTAPYIVLVGRPDADAGTAGALISELLAGRGEVHDAMLSGEEHMAVRYGVWSPTQTVVMLSTVGPYDALRTLSLFKSMHMTVTSDSIQAEYINPRACIMQDFMETALSTDSAVWTKLDDMATFTVTITRHDGESTPAALEEGNGLEPGERAMGKYLDIQVSEEIWSEGVDLIAGGEVTIFYTVADLDRTGDGDADDPEDLDESTLALYWYDEDTESWYKLSDEMDWVNATEVDTSDFSVFGREYAGSLRAEVHHLSLFGIAGRDTLLPTIAVPGLDLEVDEGDTVTFDGTGSTGNGAIATFTWTFEYDGQTVTLEEAEPSFTFDIPGVYNVTLSVTDALGRSATASLNVTVNEVTVILPTIARTGGDVTIEEGQDTTFDGRASEGNGDIAMFTWTFVYDGQTVTLDGAMPVYTFDKPGTYVVTLNVTDSLGRSDEETFTVKVTKAPDDGDGGLSSTMLAGIAIAMIIVLLLIVGLLFGRARPRPKSVGRDEEEPEEEPEAEPEEEPEEPPDEALADDDLEDEVDEEEETPEDDDQEVEAEAPDEDTDEEISNLLADLEEPMDEA